MTLAYFLDRGEIPLVTDMPRPARDSFLQEPLLVRTSVQAEGILW
jgi:hypothetical protein